jgi:hypothetical protein
MKRGGRVPTTAQGREQILTCSEVQITIRIHAETVESAKDEILSLLHAQYPVVLFKYQIYCRSTITTSDEGTNHGN